MKKPHKHTELSPVSCAHARCAMVNGKEGVIRRRIKANVVERKKDDPNLVCYPCSVFLKTGKTLRQQKADREQRARENREEERYAQEKTKR